MFEIALLRALLFFFVVIASGAIVPLWKEGGARSEGVDSFVEYSGPLSYVPFVWAVVTLLTVFFFFVRYKSARRFDPLSIGFLFCSYAIVSVFWSEDLFGALKVVYPMLSGLLLANVSIRRYGSDFVLRVFGFSFFFISILSYGYSILVPSYGISVGLHEGLWQGAFNHKNHLGNNMALAVSVMLILASRSSGKFWFYSASLPLMLTILSGSTTSIICSLISFGFYFFLKHSPFFRSFLCKKTVIRGCLAYVLALTLFVFLFSFYASSVDLFGKDATYSGRDKIWMYFAVASMNNPALGVGLGQISLADEFQISDLVDEIGFAAASTHNGFIDLIYSLGFVGAALFAIYVFWSVRSAAGGRAGNLVYVGLVPLFVLNVFETRLVGFNVFFVLLVVLLYELSQLSPVKKSNSMNMLRRVAWR